MSKRLQVIFEDEEMRAIQEFAKRHRTTVAEWVRQTLRGARREEPRLDAERKLKAVRAATRHAFPAGDIQQMLDEIEQGYVKENDP